MMKNRVLFLLLILVRLTAWKCAMAAEHVIEKGETSLQIAIDHNLTMEQLSQLNPGVDLEMMMVGDVLIVPDEGTSFEDYLNKLYGEMVRVDDLHCDVMADRSALCLFHLTNLSELPLFDVQLKATVRGVNGADGQADSAIALMQILPGESLPVFIPVSGNFDAVENASVNVTNLSYSEQLTASFRVSSDYFRQTDRFLPDGAGATSVIVFNSSGSEAYQNKKINVLAAAYSADGRLAGVRSLYSDYYARLDVTVYSAGPAIDSVKLILEAY